MNSLSYIFKSPIDLSDEMIPINNDLCIGKIYPSQVDEGFIHVTRKVLNFYIGSVCYLLNIQDIEK